MRIKSYTYYIFFLFILLASCSEDDSLDQLDMQLKEAMIRASEGNGLDHYKLPQANDLRSIPQDPNNRLTPAKIELGKNLFHETAFSTDGKFPITQEEYSCASCHHADAGFQAGVAQGIGEGGQGFGNIGETRTRNLLCAPELCDVQPIRTPTAMNGAFQELMLWNGQFGATGDNRGTEDQWTPDTPKEINNLGFEGLETQAIAGLAVHRIKYSEQEAIEHGYKQMFDAAFPEVDASERYTRITAGLAIAAYERTLTSYNAPFQKYLRGNDFALSDYEKEGALLFFDKAECYTCHTGPALNKMEFHALGMNEFEVDKVTHYNPEDPAQLGRFSFTKREEDKYKFKTPQLYNLRGVGFLGHGASFTNVKEVIEYKNNGVAENPKVTSNYLSPHFKPLGLTPEEVDKLTAFIEVGLTDPDLDRFVPDVLPSGNCFPNADEESRFDLGCD